MNMLPNLMKKQMTRKEFLMTIGLGIAAVLGLLNVLRVLSGKDTILNQGGFGKDDGNYGDRKT